MCVNVCVFFVVLPWFLGFYFSGSGPKPIRTRKTVALKGRKLERERERLDR